MNRASRTRPEALPAKARRLASGVAAFFRQLSLFDLPTVSEIPSSAPPRESPARAARIAPPSRPATTDSGFGPLLIGPYARIEVAVKPRLHESWRVTWNRRREALRLEIPALLAEAPADAKAALLDWTLLASSHSRRGRPDPLQRARRQELERLIRSHLQLADGANPSPAAARRSARDARKIARLKPRGECHDLEAILRAVNVQYFAGGLQARITWAARLGGLSTHTMATDALGRPYHLLTISRGYDVPEATSEIVGGVVYHECLHIAIPPRREAGRRVVHGPDFRKREREYDHYAVWRAWHRDELPLALRRLQRQAHMR